MEKKRRLERQVIILSHQHEHVNCLQHLDGKTAASIHGNAAPAVVDGDLSSITSEQDSTTTAQNVIPISVLFSALSHIRKIGISMAF